MSVLLARALVRPQFRQSVALWGPVSKSVNSVLHARLSERVVHLRNHSGQTWGRPHHDSGPFFAAELQGASILGRAFLSAKAPLTLIRAFAAAASAEAANNDSNTEHFLAPVPPLPPLLALEAVQQKPPVISKPGLWPTLWRILRGKLGWLALSAGLAVAAASLGLASPALVGQLWDALGSVGAGADAAAADVLGPALKLGALFLARFVLQLASGSLLSGVSEDVANELRTLLFTHLLHADLGLYDTVRTADLLTGLSEDAREVRDAVRAVIGEGVPASVRVIGGTLALAATSGKMSLALAVALLPCFYAGTVMAGRLRTLSRRSAEKAGAAAGVAHESLSHVRTVRSYTAEGEELGRYSSALHEGSTLTRQIGLEYSAFRAAVSLGLTALAGGVVLYGGYLVSNGELTRGAVTSFLMQAFSLEGALESLNMLGARVARAQGAGERIATLLDSKPAVLTSGTAQWPGLAGEVQFTDVHFAYPARPDVPVLKGVTLHLPPGKTVALVGPSGSGKSTVASLLLGLYEPNAGNNAPGCITIDGRPLGAVDMTWLRGRMAVVPQEPTLFATTLRANIAYGCMAADDAAVTASARAAHAQEFIDRLPAGLDTVVGERGVSLSGGQRQRIALARALLREPRVLILDEATSALDSESEAQVQAALNAAMQHRTTLVIAHRLSTVQRADLIYVMDGGRVVESGTHVQLLAKNGVYAGLVARQRDGIVGAS